MREAGMRVAIVKSRNVCKNNDVFILHVGFGYYDLGVQIHSYGFRLMFVWWHICINWK